MKQSRKASRDTQQASGSTSKYKDGRDGTPSDATYGKSGHSPVLSNAMIDTCGSTSAKLLRMPRRKAKKQKGTGRCTWKEKKIQSAPRLR